MHRLKQIKSLYCLCLLFIAPCVNAMETVVGSGQQARETRPVANISEVFVSGSGTLYLKQGGEESLEVESDDNLMPYILTRVENGKLSIEMKNGSFQTKLGFNYYLTVRTLGAIETSGSVNIHGDELSAQTIYIQIHGSSKMRLRSLYAQTARLLVDGAGILEIEKGSTKKQMLHLSGAGIMDLLGVQNESTELAVHGASRAELEVLRELNVQVSGSGSVRYRGKPKITQTIMGAGKLVALGN